MNVTHIAIADMLMEVRSTVPAEQLGIAERLGAFFAASPDITSEVLIRWRQGDPGQVPRGDLVYDPGSTWRMYRNPATSQFHVQIEYPGAADETGPQALLTADAAWCDVLLTERVAGEYWTSLLNLGAGELLVRTRILFAGGIVFHACGIDDNGRGLVMVGHAGAGKSTHAGLWTDVPGAVVMNDDRVAVRVGNGGAMAYGTPWGGTAEIARNHRVPLAAVFLLEQAPENAVHVLSKRRAVPMLLPRCFLPYWDEELMGRALDVIESLVDRVPVYLLRCRPEAAAVELVRSVL